ncbi:MAG: squalene synthase HpnC [Vicinamibacterales bacterium]
MVAVEAAYRACAQTAAAHYENFPVASWLLPKAARPHIAAIYAFARGADDLADEGAAADAERLSALTAWQTRLHRAVDRFPHVDDTAPFVALAATIRQLDLPLALFDDLISAFGQDVSIHRYETWAQVLDYCRRSANPIGRLVLRACDVRDAELDRTSDCVCTALQLANFWQDLERDWTRGRLYLPREIWRAAGAREEEFNPNRLTPAWRAAVGDVLDRTQALFDDGKPICDRVGGRLRYELRLTWLGGTRIVERLRQTSASPVHVRPSLGLGDAGPLIWRMVTWSSARHAMSR